MWRGGKKIKIIVGTGKKINIYIKKKEILLGHVWLQPHLGYFVILKSFCERIFFFSAAVLFLFCFIYIPSDVFFFLFLGYKWN